MPYPTIIDGCPPLRATRGNEAMLGMRHGRQETMTGTPLDEATLVALDLEGSGAQDRDGEAILEIPTAPIINARPDQGDAYCTLVNPGRPIPARPWILPGLTNQTLRAAPRLETIEPVLARRLNGCYLVGHNVGVDWRLLHRRWPTIRPLG
jgi:DNA polymerase III epsilon subunit-like protein